MPLEATRWTADMVRTLPDDGNRYEVVDGEQPEGAGDPLTMALPSLFARIHGERL